MANYFNMYILHIETATSLCSVAISRGAALLKTKQAEGSMRHASRLAPMITELLEEAHLAPKDLGAISVSAGPGSYTGLRVGASTAKAMAYSLRIPLVPVPTLEALASAALTDRSDQIALPMIDARRNEVYTALYNRELVMLIPVSSVILEHPELPAGLPKGQSILICGDGAAKVQADWAPGVEKVIMPEIVPDARHLVAPALNRLERDELADPIHFVPFYLKPPNITTQKGLWVNP